MPAPNTGKPAADPLDGLANSVERDASQEQLQLQQQQLTPEQQAQLAEGEQKMRQLLRNVQTFTEKALRAVRARLAVKLPEIRTEWTDADLANFAEAVPPVIMKRVAILAPILGNYPEECTLLLAAVPLAMGYVSALSSRDDKGHQAQLPGPLPHTARTPGASSEAPIGPGGLGEAAGVPQAQVVG